MPNLNFKSIARDPQAVIPPTKVKLPRSTRTPKYTWTVIFKCGEVIDVPAASGARDAGMQAMWIYQSTHKQWPGRIREVQRRATDGNEFMYRSYRWKR